MPNPRRHPNVVRADEVDSYAIDRGKHHVRGHILGRAAGSLQLGGTLTELPPGAVSFPCHYHCANEEAVFVVSGTGTARIGEQRVAVGPGDWIAYPVGPAFAHQMINDGSVPLVYLCISTTHKTEVVGYPDSKKIGTRAGESFDTPWIRTITREGPALDYWDGEPDAQ